MIQLQRADGDLKVTSDELAVDEDAKVSLHKTCMLRAEDLEADTKSSGEELKALAEDKRIIKEMTDDIGSQTAEDSKFLGVPACHHLCG